MMNEPHEALRPRSGIWQLNRDEQRILAIAFVGGFRLDLGRRRWARLSSRYQPLFVGVRRACSRVRNSTS
jgi:hypothetical protein